ncbi:hypothetical protein PT974_07924 [Cladobotryum mycophilum]|uniref:Uncharacterized protein n=1 Tax=Cladobotryum mycophilum TaxID=491253 RepID=A0ABR0SBX2_9HYPO
MATNHLHVSDSDLDGKFPGIESSTTLGASMSQPELTDGGLQMLVLPLLAESILGQGGASSQPPIRPSAPFPTI